MQADEEAEREMMEEMARVEKERKEAKSPPPGVFATFNLIRNPYD